MTAVDAGPALDVLGEALVAYDAGLCVIRCNVDGSKAPKADRILRNGVECWEWKHYQRARPKRNAVRDWFHRGYQGVGVICGDVSDGLEMFEFEGRAVDGGLWDQYVQLVDANGLGEVLDRIIAGWSERSPSGGVHLLYKWHPDEEGCRPGSEKLALGAREPKPDGSGETWIPTLIETKGEGGFTIIAPSAGTTHKSGLPWVRMEGGPATVATITAAERQALFTLVRTFHVEQPVEELPPVKPAEFKPTGASSSSSSLFESVLEDLGRRSWADVLGAYGWSFSHQATYQGNRVDYWTRPGKSITDGHSASTNSKGTDRLVNFSQSVSAYFEAYSGVGKATSYDKLDVLANYEHNGDRTAAAKAYRDKYLGGLPPRSSDEEWLRDQYGQTSNGADGAPPQGDGDEVISSSYRPVRLADVKPGDVPPPTILTGLDGDSLFYPGRTNMLMAESEAGKTWLAYHAAHQVLDAGGRILVLDYEDDQANFKARMLAIGVQESVIDDPARVHYVRPEAPIMDHRTGRITLDGIDFGELLEGRYELVIIDGVTDAMQLEGFDPNSNAELAIWNRLVPKRLALRTGAAVVMLDHYGKVVGDPRYAIGGQHKRSMITGASYGLEVVEAIGRGKSGGGRFIVGKDRPGYVRGRSTKIDRGMLVAAVYSVDHDEITGVVRVRVEPFLSAATHPDQLAVDLALVRSLYEALGQAGVPMSGRGWKGAVQGKDDRKQGAMDWLVGKGYVLIDKQGRSHLHRQNPAKPKDW